MIIDYDFNSMYDRLIMFRTDSYDYNYEEIKKITSDAKKFMRKGTKKDIVPNELFDMNL